MISLGHVCGGDLQIDGTGLSLVSGAEATKQRILRRLLSNPGGYIWHHDYGAGLPQMVGGVVDEGIISTSIRQSLAEDVGVDSSRPIDVHITPIIGGTVRCHINYFDRINNEAQSLKISI